MARTQTISIIIPMYNEELNAPLLYDEIMRHVAELSYRFDFIYVDDGSKDGSVAAIERLIKRHHNVRLIEFSRNFGKEAAVSAGLHAARGDASLILDADFQHPPCLINEFIEKWQNGADVVVGVMRYGSADSWLKKFTSNWYYRVIKPITTTDLIPHATDFRLLDKRVTQAFSRMTEHNRMTRGLIDWLGFRRDFVYFEAAKRKHGVRGYSYRKLVVLAMQSFTSYSLVPLKLAGYAGAVIVMISGPFGLFVYAESHLFGDPLNWRPSNVVLLALLLIFLIGIVLACMGLVAMYIAHIHAEVVDRPLYVIRQDISGTETLLEEASDG